MKLNLFTPNHFRYYYTSLMGIRVKKESADAELVANLANDILNDYIESLPLMQGRKSDASGDIIWVSWEIMGQATHQARLICIEPIEKKWPCSHENILIERNAKDFREVFCQKCGKKLKAKWEVDE